MKIIVSGCDGCPFFRWPDKPTCEHPSWLALDEPDIQVVVDQKGYSIITPEWCPLKKEPLIIELTK